MLNRACPKQILVELQILLKSQLIDIPQQEPSGISHIESYETNLMPRLQVLYFIFKDIKQLIMINCVKCSRNI